MREWGYRGKLRKRAYIFRLLRLSLLLLSFLLLGGKIQDLGGRAEEAEQHHLKCYYALEYSGRGWSDWSNDNQPQSRRDSFPSALKIALKHQPEGMSGTVQYQVNISGQGWSGVLENGQSAGLEGGAVPLEGLKVWLNGQLSENYDVYTKAMVNGEWLDWVMNGQEAGKVGVGTHIDGIRVSVVKKGEQPTAEEAGQAQSAQSTVDPDRPMVALTFDDGPGKYEDRILSSLEANKARATFFMVGNLVARHSAVVKRMADDGCELGNHSWAHENLSKLSSAAVRNSIQKTNDAIRAAGGHAPTLVRPPYGATGGQCKSTLTEMGYAPILWSIDTLDWKTRNSRNTVKVVLSQVKDGDIVLMHSIYPQSAEAAELLIPELTRRGYQLVTVSELAAARGGIHPGHSYGSFRKK